MLNFIGHVTLKSTLVSIGLLLALYLGASFTQGTQGSATVTTLALYMMAAPFIVPACALWVVLQD